MEGRVKITRLSESDMDSFLQLIALFNDVFGEPRTVASQSRLKKLLGKADFHVIVASKNNALVGGLTAYELAQYYNDQSELYIYDMAVTAELHHQGIGKELISYLKDYSKGNGIKTIFVEAHAEDEQAIRFYESTFGKSEQVDHFNLDLN